MVPGSFPILLGHCDVIIHRERHARFCLCLKKKKNIFRCIFRRKNGLFTRRVQRVCGRSTDKGLPDNRVSHGMSDLPQIFLIIYGDQCLYSDNLSVIFRNVSRIPFKHRPLVPSTEYSGRLLYHVLDVFDQQWIFNLKKKRLSEHFYGRTIISVRNST